MIRVTRRQESTMLPSQVEQSKYIKQRSRLDHSVNRGDSTTKSINTEEVWEDQVWHQMATNPGILELSGTEGNQGLQVNIQLADSPSPLWLPPHSSNALRIAYHSYTSIELRLVGRLV
ncbi:unnamed protein product [Cuscuta europaea]|uniref:Uncharacterized protein n=1 Tax=Cuscuta europaea TaxID=41803 RepID=A0A9P0YKA3_CUSEU|nr:unnamed protein product [Cuscuta europaea]